MEIDCLDELCRFCLYKKDKMRYIPIDELSQTDIPELFEIVTSVKLEIKSDYSSYICTECEERMRLVAETRKDFLQILDYWMKFIESGFTTVGKAYNNEPSIDRSYELLDEIKTDVLPEHSMIFKEEYDHNNESSHNLETPELDNEAKMDVLTEESLERVKGTKRVDPLLVPVVESVIIKKEDNGIYECDICGHITSYRKSIVRHLRNHVTPTRPRKSFIQRRFKCPMCPQKSFYKNRLVDHIRVHTGERPYACDHMDCQFTFSTLQAFKRHSKLHLKGKRKNRKAPVVEPNPYKCDLCNVVYSHRRSFALHQRNEHNIPIPLAKPKPIIDGTNPIKRHAYHNSRNPNLKPINCNLCESIFYNRNSMATHLKTVHPLDYQDEWKLILQTVCLICNEIFKNSEDLANHRLETHNKHQCTICRQHFISTESLKHHMDRHSKKERTCVCQECGAAYLTNSDLKQHERRVHSTYRPYSCYICQSAFSQNYELTSHLKLVHSGERPWNCTTCSKSFKSSTILYKHVRTKHTDEDRYKCNICNQLFLNGSALTEHKIRYCHEDNDASSIATAI